MIRRLPRLALVSLLVLTVAAPSFAQPAPPPAGERPRLTKPPKLVKFVEAEYPEQEKAAGRTASVVLQIAISENGSVADARVLESAGPAFDAAALEAVRGFFFEPAEIDGKPAPIRINYRYEFVFKPAEPTTAIFRGTVRVRGSGEALGGVRVDLDGGQSAVTDESGRFEFPELPPGKLRITLSRDDLKAMQTEETLEAGQAVEAIYEVDFQQPAEPGEDSDDMEIVIVAPKLEKQVVSTKIEADQASRVAGTQGDVLKIVENMPGVARAAAGSGEVVVWGAAPEDTRTYVGAVRIPMLYHFGGLRSVVHNDNVKSVELIPGGYGAAHGRGLGGLVQVVPRDPVQDRLRGSLQLDVLDASAALSAPLGEKWSFSVAGRRSHITDLSGLLSDQSFEEYFTLPDYYDGQARIRRRLAEGEWIDFGTMISGDRQERTQPSSDPARRVSETRSLNFQRYELAYHRKLESGDEVDAVPWYGRDETSRQGDFGGTPTLAETETQLAGFRAEWRGRLGARVTGLAGLDFELSYTESKRSGSITSPPREGDAYVFGRPPADQVNFDEWKTVIASAAPYGEIDLSLFEDRLHVIPGLRLDPYFVSVNRRRPSEPSVPNQGAYSEDLALQPRLTVRYAPISRVTFKGAAGLYAQAPLADDLSSVFGNPALGTSRGRHFVGGVNTRVFELVSVETTVFYTRSKSLVTRNPSSTPRIAEALSQDGEGRSIGAQFLLRHDKGDGVFFGWVAYTLLRSERKDSKSAPWRLFDFDQTHVLTALASLDLGAGFEIGARVRAASGFPRTPVRGAYFDARRNRYEPLLGPYNGDRIPYFLQLDARIAKRFAIGSTELEAYLDVQNVTNRENPEEIAYFPDYSERRYILGLPILPVAGARWSF